MNTASVGVIALFALILIYTVLAARIVKEHEQGIITRFGRFLAIRGPGLQLIVPGVDRMRKVDLRELAVIERIDPDSEKGRVKIWGASWPAKSGDGTSIGPGTPVEVAALDGKFVVVRPTL